METTPYLRRPSKLKAKMLGTPRSLRIQFQTPIHQKPWSISTISWAKASTNMQADVSTRSLKCQADNYSFVMSRQTHSLGGWKHSELSYIIIILLFLSWFDSQKVSDELSFLIIPVLHLWNILYKFQTIFSCQINLISLFSIYLPYLWKALNFGLPLHCIPFIHNRWGYLDITKPNLI